MRAHPSGLSNLTIGKRLLVLNALVVVLALATGAFSRSQIKDDGPLLKRVNETLHASLEADMMHDAIRADVFGARLAATPEDRESSLADLKDHSATMNDRFKTLADNVVDDAEVSKSVAGAQAEVNKYFADAQTAIKAIGTPDEQAANDAFVAQFENLETLLAEESDAVVNSADGQVAKRADAAANARRIVLILTALSAISASILVAYITAASPAR